MIEALTIAAAATIKLLESITALPSLLVRVHVFRANARTRHPPDRGPGVVPERLARPGRRIKPRTSEAILVKGSRRVAER